MDNLEKSVELFKTLGDITRIRILKEIFAGEKNVNDIVTNLAMTQSAISHQLRILKTNNLVKSNRRGKEVYYSLNDEHVKLILEQVNQHVSHS